MVVFPVVMYGCESWTIKKAEHQRTDAFELWCWRRFLRVPWTKDFSSQSSSCECFFLLRFSAEGNRQSLLYFFFLGSKITADGDCSHEIKRCLLLGRKSMTNINNILKKQRHYLANKVCLVKAMVFSVVMHGCKS